MPDNSKNHIELRSEEIDEILGKTPNSLIRWGITVFFVLLVSLLIGTWFIKYPQTYSTAIKIMPVHPSQIVINKQPGIITSIAIKDGEIVTKNQRLCTITEMRSDTIIQIQINAPINGSCYFHKLWRPSQEIGSQEPLFSILSNDDKEYIGSIAVPAKIKTKITPGQTVLVSTEEYPAYDFGSVKGVIKRITQIPAKDKYYAEVGFPTGLTTNQNKKLDFKTELNGLAAVILSEERLLKRIIH